MKLSLSKKIFSVTLTSIVLFSFNSIPANAVADVPVDCGTSGTFTITNNMVTGNTLCVGVVNVPAGVIGIQRNAFIGNADITQVNLPSSVFSIGAYSFLSTTRLTTINLENITYLGHLSFIGSGLTSLIVGSNLDTVPQSGFEGLSSLLSLTISSGLKNIGVQGFKELPTSFTSVTIPATVTSIDENAFRRDTILDVKFLGNAPAMHQEAFPFNSDPEPDIGFKSIGHICPDATGFANTTSLTIVRDNPANLCTFFTSTTSSDDDGAWKKVTQPNPDCPTVKTIVINFANDVAILNPSAKKKIKEVKSSIQKCSYKKVTSTGYTSIDKPETLSFNIFLQTITRATTVKDAVKRDLGSSSKNYQFKTFGNVESVSIKAYTKTKSTTANRRVEVTLSK